MPCTQEQLAWSQCAVELVTSAAPWELMWYAPVFQFSTCANAGDSLKHLPLLDFSIAFSLTFFVYIICENDVYITTAIAIHFYVLITAQLTHYLWRNIQMIFIRLRRFFWATRFLIFIFSLFFVTGPWARLSWPSRQLLSARKSTVPYRIVSYHSHTKGVR